MNSRERLQATLNHEEPDRVCVDLGSTAVTGIHVAAVDRLRRAVLGDPGRCVNVIEPYQMLGEIDPALRDALGIDVAGVMTRTTMFGFENRGWKPFTLFDGTEVRVPAGFQVDIEDGTGDLLIYPAGDRTAPPSGRMPKGFHFFDTIIRQPPLDEDALRVEDNLEEFGPLSTSDLSHYWTQTAILASETECGVILTIPGTAFGDIALVPAPWMKNPKGIRDIEEWYVSTLTRQDHVRAIFERQCAIALANLERIIALVGDRAHAAFVSGTDFGTQRGLFAPVETYRELFKPFHARVCRLIHERTPWKVFIHSCGSVIDLIPDLIEAGFDILNPVQTSAAGMDARTLKREFGRHVTFWGGGVDTQKTMEFGTPDEVYRQVRERIDIFAPGGGFVFNPIHNIQARTPTANMLAMFKAIRDSAT